LNSPPFFTSKIILTLVNPPSKTHVMVVKLRPETESRLQQLAATTGREPAELVEDAMAGYLAELAEVRATLDARYDQIKSGAVRPLPGDEVFKSLRRKSKDRRPK
jgi:predicted transcriptional regulator